MTIVTFATNDNNMQILEVHDVEPLPFAPYSKLKNFLYNSGGRVCISFLFVGVFSLSFEQYEKNPTSNVYLLFFTFWTLLYSFFFLKFLSNPQSISSILIIGTNYVAVPQMLRPLKIFFETLPERTGPIFEEFFEFFMVEIGYKVFAGTKLEISKPVVAFLTGSSFDMWETHTYLLMYPPFMQSLMFAIRAFLMHSVWVSLPAKFEALAESHAGLNFFFPRKTFLYFGLLISCFSHLLLNNLSGYITQARIYENFGFKVLLRTLVKVYTLHILTDILFPFFTMKLMKYVDTKIKKKYVDKIKNN